MGSYFLGVDAGATKTHALVLAEEGSLCGFGEGGSGNHESFGFDRAREEIAKAVTEALSVAGLDPSRLTRSCYCLAGADVSSDFEEIPNRIIAPITGNAPFELKNDSFGCLRGGTKDPFGVMINCGTAQVAVGRNRQGAEIRLGGYGPEFGDLTGGWIISLKAIAAIVRAWDGRGEATALSDLILKAAGSASIPDFIDRTYRDQEFLMELGITRLVFEASLAGDSVAKEIVLEAAHEMAVTATALIGRLEMQRETFDLIAAGSVFKGEDPIFTETVKSAVLNMAPNARFTTPLFDPVVGAALLALESSGLQTTEEFYQRLEATLPGS
jgi:N-acetylglucosamine kinase-like BadF-type ATPase